MRGSLFDNRNLFAEMDAIWRDFDAVFHGLDGQHGLRQLGASGVLRGPHPTADGWTLTADLPGVKPEDLELTVTGRTLEIRAERTTALPEDAVIRHRERGGWTFSKRLRLPDEVDGEAVAAVLEHGVLNVTLPRRAEAAPRRITVHHDATE